MDNKLQVSNNNELTVIDQREVLGKDFKIYGDIENPLFLAKDVAGWIDYEISNVSKMVKNVDEDEKIITRTNNTSATFLTEDGLYEVLMQSRKPIAKQFKKKVKEILKSIRRTGQYSVANTISFDVKETLRTDINQLVEEKIKQIEGKCSEYYRPSSAEKHNITQYIKKRLGIRKANDEYELVKQRVLIKLDAKKWEDIDVETLKNSLNVIDESIRVIKADRPYEQKSMFDI